MMRLRYRAAFCLLLVLATVHAGCSACTGTLIGVHRPTALDGQESKAKVLAAEEVTVNTDALRFGSLELDAFGKTLELTGKLEFSRVTGGHLWTGHVDGDELSHAVFASRGEVVFGFVRTSSGLVLELRPMAPGKHVLRQLDGNSFTPEAAPIAVKSSQIAAAATCAQPQNEVVNIAMYYTPRARAKLGGDTEALTAIDASILSANQVYVDSQVRVRLNLVEAAAVTYDESTGQAALDALTKSADGNLDNLHTRRDAVAADVVVLIAETDVCGIANQLVHMPGGDASAAFAVVDPDCFVNLGLVHEVGHVMGAHHDAFVFTPNDTVAYPWAHGWVDLKMKRVSIMAYGTECRAKGINDCVGVGRFSNPSQLLGDASKADNHRVLNDTASTVASYRCSPVNPISLGSRFVSTTMNPNDNMGNFWYLDRREQPVEVVFENLGNSPWDSTYALALVAPSDNRNSGGGELLNIVRVPLDAGEVVGPGQRKTFRFSFIGVGRADNFQWQMTNGSGTPFGDRTPRVTLQPKGF